MINANDVKKDLLKSKVNAKLSHYVSGNLYYTVELVDGTYQFPIPVVEKRHINFELNVNQTGLWQTVAKTEAIETILSEDLGTTTFAAEMRGSELNRWIVKAIDKEEFIKIG